MYTRSFWKIFIGSVTIALGLIPVSAQATSLNAGPHATDVDQPNERSNVIQKAADADADARGYLIVQESAGKVSEGGTFFETGPISEDTLLVIANSDGSLPAGVSTELLSSIASERRAAVEPESEVPQNATTDTTTYSWSATSTEQSGDYTGGSLIGMSDTTRAVYPFSTAAGFAQGAAGSGLGFYRGYNGSEFGAWSRYYGLGATTSVGISKAIPWGNVAATKKFRAQCANTVVCWGDWD